MFILYIRVKPFTLRSTGIKGKIDVNMINTRFATSSTFYVPKIQTMVNSIFDTILWSKIDEKFKFLTSHSFTRELSLHFIKFLIS